MSVEVDYLLLLQHLRESLPDAVTALLSGISAFANSPVPILAIAVILWCVNKKSGYLVGFNYIGANAMTQTIKCVACINRPWVLDPRIVPDASAVGSATGYSFPSGHTTLAASIFGSIAYVFRKYKWLVAVLVVLILLTAFSRNWLGCHMPKDVIGGLLVSAVIFAVSLKLGGILEKRPQLDLPLAIAGIVIGIAALLFITFKPYPLEYTAAGALLVDPYDMQTDCYRSLGSFLGFFIAWIIERRFIKFSVDGPVKVRILRGIIGAAFVALMYLAVLPLVFDPIGDHWGKLLKYLVLIVLIANVYPLIFTKAEKRFVK